MSFVSPELVLGRLKLTPGQTVADLGTGAGVFALLAARQVGPDGLVYAVDVQKELLTRVDHDARSQGLNNVKVIWGNIEQAGGCQLADRSVDVVILANVLFQVDRLPGVAEEVTRLLKPGGQVLVIDWHQPVAPMAGRQLSPEIISETLIDAGLSLVEEFPAGDNHFGLIFSKH